MANDYPNSGALWPNENRNSDKHPNVRGDIKIERGLLKQLMADTDDELITIALSGWTRAYQDKKFISLKADKPFKKNNAPQRQAEPADDDDDEIPFN
jgi:hypothetical protein